MTEQIWTRKGMMDEGLLRRSVIRTEDEHARYVITEWHELATGELVKRQPVVHLKRGLSLAGAIPTFGTGD